MWVDSSVNINFDRFFYQYSLQVMVLSIRYIGCATTKYPTCFILSLLSRQNHQRPTKYSKVFLLFVYLDLCLVFGLSYMKIETQLSIQAQVIWFLEFFEKCLRFLKNNRLKKKQIHILTLLQREKFVKKLPRMDSEK